MSFVRTTYEDETELITAALEVFNEGKTVDLDPCYSIGRFWTGLEKPKLKFDLEPQTEDTIQSSCTALPLANLTVNSIMFDPPFIIGSGETQTGIMRKRFSSFKSVNALKDMYRKSLEEFLRVLRDDGVIFFKCQDTVTSGKQFLTHVWIINTAIELGYLIEDIFILVRKRAIMDPRWGKQKHARKTHSYFLVLRKK